MIRSDLVWDPGQLERMLNTPEPACLVIADITGYTSYLAGVELDHADDILADLMDTVVSALRPTFRLAKLEGDAAFTYAMTAEVDASALMDTVERTYFAFRRRLRDIAQASTCDCNACSLMPRLDLKLLAHHGGVVRRKVAGREELVGSSVIVAHRLLKNGVTDTTGISAYAFYTQDCLAAASVDDPTSLGLIEHREEYEHLGEIVGWVADLDAAWRADLDRRHDMVTEADAARIIHADLPAPPALAWDYLTSPIRRPQWSVGIDAVNEVTAGRRGVGTTNHCVHGKAAVVEEVLDWRPPEYYTWRFLIPVPGSPWCKASEILTATPEGTHVEMRFELPRKKADRAFLEAALPQFEPAVHAGLANLIGILTSEMALRSQEASETAEPDLPVSAGRFLDSPVDSASVRSS